MIIDNPKLHQPFAPHPKKRGEKGFNRNRVATALGFDDYRSLLRLCDQKTTTRGAAEILFYTLGGKQVGAGAITGWRIAPSQMTLFSFFGPVMESLQDQSPAAYSPHQANQFLEQLASIPIPWTAFKFCLKQAQSV